MNVTVADEFSEDLVKINGPYFNDWKISLLLVIMEELWKLDDEYHYHGTYASPPAEPSTHLSSVRWSAHSVRGITMRIWYVRNLASVRVLLAEHPRTVAPEPALDVALERAERNGFPRAAFGKEE